jgi:hypothetical protein
MPEVTARVQRNADARWDKFTSDDYWSRNYRKILPEDQEIIGLVGRFFVRVLAGRRVRRSIDVGSGANLYPALLMLPWTERIQLTDHAPTNVQWLADQVAGDEQPWRWQPFWEQLRDLEGYRQIDEPRARLREACADPAGRPRVERLSVFDLPEARWQLGTMFFVAESITEDPAEFEEAVRCFIRALEPGAPFGAAFMAESVGYPVGATQFPALPIKADNVTECLTRLPTRDLSVELTQTDHRVRPGYERMIIATGLRR